MRRLPIGVCGSRCASIWGVWLAPARGVWLPCASISYLFCLSAPSASEAQRKLELRQTFRHFASDTQDTLMFDPRNNKLQNNRNNKPQNNKPTEVSDRSIEFGSDLEVSSQINRSTRSKLDQMDGWIRSVMDLMDGADGAKLQRYFARIDMSQFRSS